MKKYISCLFLFFTSCSRAPFSNYFLKEDFDDAKKICESKLQDENQNKNFQKFLDYSKYSSCDDYANAAITGEIYKITNYQDFDFSHLDAFKNLQRIYIKESNVLNFKNIENHSSLEKISFSQIKLNFDLCVLSKIRNLSEININESDFTEFKGCEEKFTYVKNLFITNSKLSDTNFIKKFPNVVSLYLDHNRFTDSSFIY